MTFVSHLRAAAMFLTLVLEQMYTQTGTNWTLRLKAVIWRPCTHLSLSIHEREPGRNDETTKTERKAPCYIQTHNLHHKTSRKRALFRTLGIFAPREKHSKTIKTKRQAFI